MILFDTKRGGQPTPRSRPSLPAVPSFPVLWNASVDNRLIFRETLQIRLGPFLQVSLNFQAYAAEARCPHRHRLDANETILVTQAAEEPFAILFK